MLTSCLDTLKAKDKFQTCNSRMLEQSTVRHLALWEENIKQQCLQRMILKSQRHLQPVNRKVKLRDVSELALSIKNLCSLENHNSYSQFWNSHQRQLWGEGVVVWAPPPHTWFLPQRGNRDLDLHKVCCGGEEAAVKDLECFPQVSPTPFGPNLLQLLLWQQGMRAGVGWRHSTTWSEWDR